MKYLISSRLYPNINGIYEKRYNNIYLYHNTSNNNYKLYYESETKIWNIGILGSTPLYTTEKTTDVDIFKATWIDRSTLNITTIADDSAKTNTNILVKDRVNTLLSRSQCSNCNLYVCCCELDEVDKSDLDVAKEMLKLQSGSGRALTRTSTGIIKIENASGFYTIASGKGDVEANYRVEFNSTIKNRYGHIDFRLEKNEEGKPIMLEITDQHQYYSDVSSSLEPSQYVIFTHMRIIRYIDLTYKVELFYNRNAFKNSTIVCKITVKPLNKKQWDTVGFTGPNIDTNYFTCMPPLSVDTMFTKVTGRSTFMIDKKARTAIDVQKPVAKLDMMGSIRSTSDNPYLLDKWLHADKSKMKEKDIILLTQNSFATLNTNKGFYGSETYDYKRLNRFRTLGDITVYFDGRKVLAQFTIGSVAGHSISCSGLNTTGVGIGDYVMTRYTSVASAPSTTYHDIRKVIGVDVNNNIVVDSGFTQTWYSGNVATQLNFHNATIYHIHKNTKLSGIVSLVNTTVIGSGTLFTKELLVGDSIVFVSPTNIFIREIVEIKGNSSLKIDNTVGVSTINDTFMIKLPSQLVLQDLNKNPNMVVKNDGSLQLGGGLTLLGTSNSATDGVNLSITRGKIDVISNTVTSTNSATNNTYSTGSEKVDFVKLDGNLKVEGVSKFTDNLFFCSQTNDSPAAPEITALIDTDLGDIRLKGSVVSRRVVSSNAQVVDLQTTNLFSQSSSTWSDIRLKQDVVNIQEKPEILDKINSLNPVSFKWIGTGTDDVGFIGQELLDVFPDVVETSADGVLSIHYNRLLTYMVVAMKQMNSKLKDK